MLVGYGHKGKISSMHDADSIKQKMGCNRIKLEAGWNASTQSTKPEVRWNASIQSIKPEVGWNASAQSSKHYE